MTCIAAPGRVRAEWARDHGIDGFDGGGVATPTSRRSRPSWASPSRRRSRRRTRSSCAARPRSAGRRRRPGATRSAAATAARARSAVRRGTKQSGMRAHLADACRGRRADRARRTRRRVVVEDGRAAGVEATVAGTALGPGSGGERSVVALGRRRPRAGRSSWPPGALRTPGVLERSGLDHPAIGRHLRLHPVPVVAGLLRRADRHVARHRSQAARSLEFADDGAAAATATPSSRRPATRAHGAGPAVGGRRRARRTLMARVAAYRAAHRRSPATAARAGRGLTPRRPGPDRLPARREPASRRCATPSCRWRGSPGRPAPTRSSRSGRPRRWYRPWTASAGGGVGAAFDRASRTPRSPSTSDRTGRRVLGPPDGHRPDGSGPETHACDPAGRVRSRVGSAGRDAIVPGLYVADGVAVPDRARRQPDDHDHGPRPAGRTDDPGRDRVGRPIRSGRRARPAVSREQRRAGRRGGRLGDRLGGRTDPQQLGRER